MNASKKILIIDDEEEVFILFKRNEKEYNCSFTWASNGNDAIKLVSENDFDFVILDYKFLNFYKEKGQEECTVVFSCEETFKKIKNIKPNLPVAILSGYLSLFVIDTITDISNAAFIKKPKFYDAEFFVFLFSLLGVSKL